MKRMRPFLAVAGVLILTGCSFGLSATPEVPPTFTPLPTYTQVPTFTPQPTATPTFLPSPTPEPQPTATATPEGGEGENTGEEPTAAGPVANRNTSALNRHRSHMGLTCGMDREQRLRSSIHFPLASHFRFLGVI